MLFPFTYFDHVGVSVSIDFLSNSTGGATFHCTACGYPCADWNGLRDHLRDVLWEDIFKLGGSAATDFFEWFQAGIDVYISHRKYQVKYYSLYGFQLLVWLL